MTLKGDGIRTHRSMGIDHIEPTLGLYHSVWTRPRYFLTLKGGGRLPFLDSFPEKIPMLATSEHHEELPGILQICIPFNTAAPLLKEIES